MKTLGIIHAALISTKAVQPYIDEYLPDVKVAHVVDDTIQMTNFACPPGVIPRENYYKFATYAHFLEEAGVDLIMLACSTFNKAAELARPMINTPILQIDRPMMELALECGNRIGLMATVPTTVPSSERLLRTVAEEKGINLELHTELCSDAFAALSHGDVKQHNSMLIDKVERMAESVDAIVLAQVSMSALEPMLDKVKVPVFNSGRTGFEAARRMLGLEPIKPCKQ